MPDSAVITGRRRAGRRGTVPACVILCAAISHFSMNAPVVAQAANPYGSLFIPGQPLASNPTFSVVEGKVKIPKGLGLINKGGYASRGTAVIGAALDGRIKLSLGDTVDAEESALKPATDPFAAPGGRRALNIEAEIVRRHDLTFALAGSVLDSRSDVTRKDAPRETLGEKTNTAAAAGFRLGLWRDRLRWASELGWSRFEAPIIAADAPTMRARTAQRKRATAQHHRFDAAVTRPDGLSFKGHGEFRYVPAGYVARKGNAAADRETVGFGAEAVYGAVGVKIGRSEFHNNLGRIDNALTTANRAHSGSVSLDTTSFQAGRAVPDTVTLSLAHRRVRGLTGDSQGSFAASDVPDNTTGTVGLALGWKRGAHEVNLKLAAGSLDNRQSGQETADEARRSVALGHTFKSAAWTASINLAANETVNGARGARWSVRSVAPGAELRLNAPDWPTLAGKFTLKHQRKHLPDAADSDIATTWKLGGALDFGKFLPDPARDQDLLLTFEARGNGPDATDVAGGREVDYVIGVSANIRF